MRQLITWLSVISFIVGVGYLSNTVHYYMTQELQLAIYNAMKTIIYLAGGYLLISINLYDWRNNDK